MDAVWGGWEAGHVETAESESDPPQQGPHLDAAAGRGSRPWAGLHPRPCALSGQPGLPRGFLLDAAWSGDPAPECWGSGAETLPSQARPPASRRPAPHVAFGTSSALGQERARGAGRASGGSKSSFNCE